jgi:hypothetical protein
MSNVNKTGVNNTGVNKPSLSKLYRRFAGGSSAVLPAADDLLQLARVAHAEDAASPLYADLLRFSRELESTSAQLSADVAVAFDEAAQVTHRRGNTRRAAVATRSWRGIGAIAASLVAVIGAWTALKPVATPPATPATATVTPVQDRIFAALDDRAVTSNARADEIFRDQFSSDRIFRSNDG